MDFLSDYSSWYRREIWKVFLVNWKELVFSRFKSSIVWSEFQIFSVYGDSSQFVFGTGPPHLIPSFYPTVCFPIFLKSNFKYYLTIVESHLNGLSYPRGPSVSVFLTNMLKCPRRGGGSGAWLITLSYYGFPVPLSGVFWREPGTRTLWPPHRRWRPLRFSG